MNWKIQDNAMVTRPKLFCEQCHRCMFTKEDIQSRELRGICHACIKDNGSLEFRTDIVRIILEEHD